MFYQRLRDLREDSDMNQAKIANIIGTTQSYYAQYENGKRPLPFDRVVELANFYNVSLDYIAGRTNDKRGLTRSELSGNETVLIKNFRSLSIERQSRILERMEMLMEEQETEQAQIKEVG
ncbi:MAG: helix-turn-helix domain-containing protein [Ruminococcus sp.]|nr:helix-turn-helix domain-containing protein [Ruminococcus sp.]MCM1381168.1 helix-turn-helix domain-containing protein [Muribaculaceae bacterium]MCM1479659.1 helix-turn-helix domain-containing protein [Muribaculaceae bacterium]